MEAIIVTPARDIRPGHVIDINGTRWMTTRRETVEAITTLTTSNVNHVLDIRTVSVPENYDVERVTSESEVDAEALSDNPDHGHETFTVEARDLCVGARLRYAGHSFDITDVVLNEDEGVVSVTVHNVSDCVGPEACTDADVNLSLRPARAMTIEEDC